MENADEIMIMTLRQIGCNFDETIGSFQGFTPEIFMPVCAMVINVIDSSFDLPTFVPMTGAEKYKHGSNITKALKKIGFRDECGYHLFLYPNEADTRKIITFLLEKLPRGGGSAKQEIGGDSSFYGQLTYQVRSAASQPWVIPAFQKPPLLNHFEYHFKFPNSTLSKTEEDQHWKDANEKGGRDKDNIRLNAISLVKRAIANLSLSHLSSIEDNISLLRFSLPSSGLNIHSRFVHSRKFAHEKEGEEGVDVEDVNALKKDNKENVIQQLQEDINNSQREITDTQREMEEEATKIEEVITSIANLQEITARLEEEVKVASLLAVMLPDPDGSVKKLNALNEKIMGKIRQAAAEWEQHRQELIIRYHQLMEQSRGKKSESYKLSERIKDMRKDMTSVVDDARGRQQLLQQLKQEYDGMNKSANRSVYMKKIVDTHKNLTQQHVDIDKLITDMKTLMQDSNLAEERLDRIFKEADELVYTAARFPERMGASGSGEKEAIGTAAKTVYKGLVDIHQNYSKLVKTYTQLGQVANQLLDIDERILDQGRFETDKKKKKLEEDYKELKKENKELQTKLDMLE